jgi:hypothetical protein
MSSPVRYLVRRQEYTPPTAAGVRRVLPEKWTTVATFAKPEDAYAEWNKLTLAARRTLNPFQLGGPSLFYQTSLPAFAFHDYLLDHGLTPPPTATSSSPNYVFWWVKNNRTFTDDQRAVVWQACDKLKLFEVIEEDDRRMAHVVVETAYTFSARTGEYTIAEGSYLRSAHATKHEANRACRDLRRTPRTNPLLGDEVIEWEEERRASVESVPLASGPSGNEVNVVCRQGFAADEAGIGLIPSDQLETVVVPLSADTSTSGAKAAMFTAIGRARRTVNPFVLLGLEDLSALQFRAYSRAESELPNGVTIADAFANLLRLDCTPPPPESNDLLAEWYDQVVQWSPEFIDVIWGTFADFRLFEVVEVPFG